MKKFENVDKLKHFGAGALVAVLPSAVRIIGGDLVMGNLTAVKLGVFLCVAVAAWAELKDSRSTGTPDGLDFAITVVGGLTVAVLML
ncbi:MAG: hypothetical protein ABL906_01255 [Sideroxydans sp.]